MTSKRNDGRHKLPQLTGPNAKNPTYEVGYAKPPEATQFKKGRSGNPNGRPKGSKNRSSFDEEVLSDVFLEEAHRSITINEGGRQVTLTRAQAVMRSLTVKAMKGDHRSQRLFAELFERGENRRKAARQSFMEDVIGYKIEMEHELERRERLGITGSPIVPHPDHIRIDMVTGEVTVTGPLTLEQVKSDEKIRNWIASWEEEVDELTEALTSPDYAEYRQQVEVDLERAKARLHRLKQLQAGLYQK